MVVNNILRHPMFHLAVRDDLLEWKEKRSDK